jgi:hypothetical protein
MRPRLMSSAAPRYLSQRNLDSYDQPLVQVVSHVTKRTRRSMELRPQEPRYLLQIDDPCSSYLGTKSELRYATVVPLYAARIEDLGWASFVKVECGACQHTALLTPAFLSRLGSQPRTNVLDLQGSGPVPGCGARGGAVVSISWGRVSNDKRYVSAR